MLLKTTKSSATNSVVSTWLKPVLGAAAIAGLCYAGATLAAGDELGEVMGSVKENFGTGSTFVKLMYVAEIIAGGYAWHKTKHPSAVIGIVVLALFMTFALKHWIG